MESLQILLAACAAVLALVLLRRALSEISRRPGREEVLRRVREQADREDRVQPGGRECPVCGSPTKFFRYPHISVWRCTRYPECRGFVRAEKLSRPAFAVNWERRGRGRGGSRCPGSPPGLT
ncbi:hypothetical protein GX411_06400 [Candidatus Fermentibacteria bacterium]|nr:hypothetical protein [Candidatus Fermentibacteria bacterium]